MNTGRPKITLFLDIVSPFAYIAYYILRHEPVFKRCDITYVPIFLGGLFKECGTAPPLTIKNKDKWINTERLRWAKRFSIPMQMDMPPGFPPSTVTTMRALAAVEGGQATVGLFNPQDELVHALDSLYTAFWVHHTPVYMVDPLAKTLAKALGQDQATVIMNKTSLPECKALLAANTKLAFEKGAFGLPWFSCTNSSGEEQGFWGVDHLGQVLEFLELEHPKSATWKALL